MAADKPILDLAAQSEDWAFFRSPGAAGASVGLGPFTAVDNPPADGVAFFVNDFGLGEESPWRVPARVIRDVSFSSAGASVDLNWQEPSPETFAKVFGEISEDLHEGRLQKSVPVVTERAAIDPADLRDLKGSLAQKSDLLPDPYYAYGWSEGGSGFTGATPELLMYMRKARLKTMALAGTARRSEAALFAIDQKEIREHEFVAGTLVAKFSDVGMVRRESRRIMDLGKLLHFHTPISVELYRNEDPLRLVNLLHPTPALGSLPRSPDTMAQLLKWRDELRCPSYFGAPFGYWDKGYFTCVVAIRGVHWSENEVMVPAGCGVIGESRLLNEWRELALKREAVKSSFGLSV